jgi:hypothetical protein
MPLGTLIHEKQRGILATGWPSRSGLSAAVRPVNPRVRGLVAHSPPHRCQWRPLNQKELGRRAPGSCVPLYFARRGAAHLWGSPCEQQRHAEALQRLPFPRRCLHLLQPIQRKQRPKLWPSVLQTERMPPVAPPLTCACCSFSEPS